MSIPLSEAQAGANPMPWRRAHRRSLAPSGRFAIQLEQTQQRHVAGQDSAPARIAQMPDRGTPPRFRHLRAAHVAPPVETTAAPQAAPSLPKPEAAAPPPMEAATVLDQDQAVSPNPAEVDTPAADRPRQKQGSWSRAVKRALKVINKHHAAIKGAGRGSVLARIFDELAKNREMPQAELEALVEKHVAGHQNAQMAKAA